MKISNQVIVRPDWMFKNKMVHTPSPGFRRKNELSHRPFHTPHNPSPRSIRAHDVCVAP